MLRICIGTSPGSVLERSAKVKLKKSKELDEAAWDLMVTSISLSSACLSDVTMDSHLPHTQRSSTGKARKRAGA